MNPLSKLIEHFKKMPSIGPKSAQRIAFYLLSQPQQQVEAFIDALREVKEKVRYCVRCFNITVADPCEICADKKREQEILCVVSDPEDLIALEKTGEYKGLYHVLGGLISPIDGITPEILRIKELLARVDKENIKELFFAVNPTVEGEATILYLTRLIRPLGMKMTRIAYGLPMGADIDYADELTIAKAYQGRVEI